MELRVGRGRLLCKREEVEDQLDSGLFIAESAKDALKPDHAEVLQVGEGVEGFQTGQTVYFGKYAGADVKVGDEEYLIVSAEEVLLTLLGA